MASREQALEQTRRMREQAERVVEELRAGLAECEATLASEKRSDVVRRVKGKSSLEQAIDDARRMVEVLKRAESELAGDGSAAGGRGASESGTAAEPPSGASGAGAVAEAKPSTAWRETGEREEEETPLAGVIGVIGPASRGVGQGQMSGQMTGQMVGMGRRATVLLGRH